MSLLFLIPAVWLAIAVVVVVLCRGAADGDAMLEQDAEPARRRAAMRGVVVLEETSSVLLDAAGDPQDAPEPAQAPERVLVGR